MAQCGICRDSLSHYFCKNFVETMVLLKKLLNSWFDEISFSERERERISRFSALCAHCGNSQNSLSRFFAQTLTFFVKSIQKRFYLVKMAKIELKNRNFQQFSAKLRRPKLNQSCRAGFNLLKSVEFSGDAGGCSKLWLVEYSATSGLNFP